MQFENDEPQEAEAAKREREERKEEQRAAKEARRVKREERRAEKDKMKSVEHTCAACKDIAREGMRAECGHVFCAECVPLNAGGEDGASCTACGMAIGMAGLRGVDASGGSCTAG